MFNVGPVPCTGHVQWTAPHRLLPLHDPLSAHDRIVQPEYRGVRRLIFCIALANEHLKLKLKLHTADISCVLIIGDVPSFHTESLLFAIQVQPASAAITGL